MEAGADRRAVPMGQQDCHLHQAGEDEHDELSMGEDKSMRKFINDDRSTITQHLGLLMSIWSSRTYHTHLKHSTVQRLYGLANFSSLEHTQVQSGQSCSRLYNPVNNDKYSGNRLRCDDVRKVKRSLQT
eukprot:1848837-Heterocapsa_arctica.AAC.1